MPVLKRRLPPWFRRALPPQAKAEKTHGVLAQYRLNTVCESAICPNRAECYAKKTATFMILGNTCTRRCGFCAIETGRGEVLMPDEPERVADAALALGLKYVVITSVARDDLEDEGAGHFAETIAELHEKISDVEVEVLTPDFHARPELIKMIVDSRPEVFNHNLETVDRLQNIVRPQAGYGRSLQVLETAKQQAPEMMVKSGLMLGLGEVEEEVLQAAGDLRKIGCDILTLGQYLSPGGEDYLKVEKYFSPEEFDRMADLLRPMGFKEVFAGPHVRSSYHAGETFRMAELEMKS